MARIHAQVHEKFDKSRSQDIDRLFRVPTFILFQDIADLSSGDLNKELLKAFDMTQTTVIGRIEKVLRPRLNRRLNNDIWCNTMNDAAQTLLKPLIVHAYEHDGIITATAEEWQRLATIDTATVMPGQAQFIDYETRASLVGSVASAIVTSEVFREPREFAFMGYHATMQTIS